MSLEDALNRLAAAVEAQNALSGQKPAAVPEAETKKATATKAAAKPAAKAAEPAPEATEPKVTFDQVAKTLDTLASKNRDLALKTLQDLGCPEKDGVPKFGLVAETDWPRYLEALGAAVTSLDAPKASASFV